MKQAIPQALLFPWIAVKTTDDPFMVRCDITPGILTDHL